MPQVDIDFGDAPDSYGTLLDDDGARHTIVNDASPRIGRFVDGEVDSLGINSDDFSASITVVGNVETPGNSGPFTINGSTISVTSDVVSGDNLSVTIDGVETVFELLSDVDRANGRTVTQGRVEVPFLSDDTRVRVAFVLINSMSDYFAAEGLPISASSGTTFSQLDVVLRDLDDEDGVPVGSFVGTTTTTGLFLDIANSGLDAQNQPSTSDPANVVGFLNIADESGTVIDIPVIGEGILDAWIDFDGDGVFEPHEKAIHCAAVTDGVNRFRVYSHDPALNASEGLTWARFRISTEGVHSPNLLATDGEVEDHQVQIFNITAPTLDDDMHTVDEDQIPATDGSDAFLLSTNDTLPQEEFILPEYILDLPPVPNDPLNPNQANKFKSTNGIVTILDASTGLIEYQPDPDFHGTDIFRYQVTTQRNDGIGEAPPVFAEVTITVNPINDAPLAVSKIDDEAFATPEDTTLVIVDPAFPSTLAALIGNALPDGDTRYPTFPFDESNQELNVVAITANGVTLTSTGSARTLHGEISAIFSSSTGFLTSLRYEPDPDFNSINPVDGASTFSSNVFGDPQIRRFDTFRFHDPR